MISVPPADRKNIQLRASKWSMYAGTHFTDPGRMESLLEVNCGKEGHLNIQTSTRLGVETGTLGLVGRDPTTVPTPLLHFHAVID